MDPLSEVIALLKPQSYLTAGFDAGGDWSVRFDDQAGRMKCYAVTQGCCWLMIDGVEQPVRLTEGQCFVLPSGRDFTLASAIDRPSVLARDIFVGKRPSGVAVVGSGGDVYLAGSRFDVRGRSAEALLKALPPIIHIEAGEDQATLRWSIRLMMAEMRDDRPGSGLAAHHLAHLMLLQTLRLYLAQGATGIGWFTALADPRLNSAIGAMHSEPARRWTLDDLASRAGMSRSSFAQHFRERVGETPIAYLSRWRMMLAGDRLNTGRESVGEVARALGYISESAFSTAFRREMGCSPRRFGQIPPSGGISAAYQIAPEAHISTPPPRAPLEVSNALEARRHALEYSGS